MVQQNFLCFQVQSKSHQKRLFSTKKMNNLSLNPHRRRFRRNLLARRLYSTMTTTTFPSNRVQSLKLRKDSPKRLYSTMKKTIQFLRWRRKLQQFPLKRLCLLRRWLNLSRRKKPCLIMKMTTFLSLLRNNSQRLKFLLLNMNKRRSQD